MTVLASMIQNGDPEPEGSPVANGTLMDPKAGQHEDYENNNLRDGHVKQQIASSMSAVGRLERRLPGRTISC